MQVMTHSVVLINLNNIIFWLLKVSWDDYWGKLVDIGNHP